MNSSSISATASADDDLRRAAELSGRGRRATRWYANYLLVFALGSFALSVLTGTLPTGPGVLVTTLLWMGLIVALSVYAARQRAAIRNFGRLHGAVMAGWTLAWCATVVLGQQFFAGRLWWWVLGGIAVALPPLVGARVTRRRAD